jgi:hypothetical protein
VNRRSQAHRFHCLRTEMLDVLTELDSAIEFVCRITEY